MQCDSGTHEHGSRERSHVHHQSSKYHEHPSILSQLCMDSDDWQCVQIHNSAEHYTVEKADLPIPVLILDWIQVDYTTCVVSTNYTDVIVALLFHVPNCLQWGLRERWIRAGRDSTKRLCTFTFYLHGWVLIIYVHTFQHYIASNAVISPYILIPRKRLSLLKTMPLHGFGTATPLTSATIQRAEQYLVNVVEVGSKSSNFEELREHQVHFSKSISHQNLISM